MSKRFDITDGTFATTKKNGLIYTEELGWIDLGHANPAGAEKLWFEMIRARGGDSEFYEVNYHQSMSKNIHGLNINTGIYRRCMVRRG